MASKTPSRRTPSRRSNKKPAPRPDLVQKLLQSHEAHVRDLQVLLDKAAEREARAGDREAELAAMIKMVMEERFYRPVITRDNTKPRQQAPIVPLDSLSDVSSFSSDEDTKRMQAHDDLTREIENEFKAIFTEHQEAHEEKEANAITA